MSARKPVGPAVPYVAKTAERKCLVTSLSLALSCTVLVALTGCKPVGPNYARPGYDAPAAYKEAGATTVLVPPPAPSGGAWHPASPSDGMLRGKWWEIYHDAQLNQLEEHIVPENLTLRQAMEAYLAAHDQVTAARSALFPTFSGNAATSRGQASVNGLSYSPSRPNSNSDFSISGTASREPYF